MFVVAKVNDAVIKSTYLPRHFSRLVLLTPEEEYVTKKWCLHRKEIGPDGERVFAPITFHEVYCAGRGGGHKNICPSDPNFPQVCQTLEKDGREEEGRKSQPHLISVHVWVERTGKWLRRGSRKGGEGKCKTEVTANPLMPVVTREEETLLPHILPEKESI